MSIDSNHAFGSSLVLSKPNATERKLWQFLGILNRQAQIKSQIAQAWEQFSQQANLSDDCLLGPNSWCVNSQGDPSLITLEGRVICRGLLRVERFGHGRILIHPEVYIGDDCLISCADSIEIGSFTLIGHGVHIFDNDTHPVDWQARLNDWKSIVDKQKHLKPEIAKAPVFIGQHVWIGFNSILLKGVTIGSKSVVAAGSVVTKDIPPNVLVAGNPAKVIKEIED
jgi:acetyltransferase-like isoleucine patch superfamily enzyme